MRIALIGLMALSVAGTSYAAADESLVYDAASGNYVLTYDCGEDGGIQQTVLVPANKIAPAIDSSFDAKGDGIAYRYGVTLGAASRQPLLLFALDPVLDVSVAASSPAGWEAFHLVRPSGETRVGWNRKLSAADFAPGSRQQGFALSSRHLPGVVMASFKGNNGGTWGFPCEMPGDETDVGEGVAELLKNDKVPGFAAAPAIRMTEPFNAGSVLSDLRNHVSQLEQWELLDATFGARIRADLTQAIDRLNEGDSAAAAAVLRDLRKDLRKKHFALQSGTVPPADPPHDVPRAPVTNQRKLVNDYHRVLAARVIDFDVEYVEDRLGAKPR